MNDCTGFFYRIIQDNRHTVGNTDQEQHSRPAGHKRIRMGKGIVITAGPPSYLAVSDGDYVIFMSLLRCSQYIEAAAQMGTETAPVFQDA